MKNLAIFIVWITLCGMAIMFGVSHSNLKARVRLLERQLKAIELVPVTQNNKTVGYIIIKEFRMQEKENEN